MGRLGLDQVWVTALSSYISSLTCPASLQSNHTALGWGKSGWRHAKHAHDNCTYMHVHTHVGYTRTHMHVHTCKNIQNMDTNMCALMSTKHTMLS